VKRKIITMYRVKATNTNVIFCSGIPTKEEAEKQLLTIQGLISLSGIKTDYEIRDFAIEYYETN